MAVYIVAEEWKKKKYLRDLDTQKKIKFIDFCAGIGGGKLGLELSGLECVGYSEIDQSSVLTYKIFFGEDGINYGDLMEITPSVLIDFDVLIAGFPCQTFSIVGQRQGMKDFRGKIINGLINILTNKSVPYFILENVKGLVNHDKGNTIEVILQKLDTAGYQVEWKILDSINYGVPHTRERVYFVGIRKNLLNNSNKFTWPTPIETPDLKGYLIDNKNSTLDHKNNATFKKYLNNKYNKGKFKLEEILSEDFLVLDTRQSDLRLYRGRVPTLRTGRHGVLYVKEGKLRKLSGYESLLLQGFPKGLAEKARGKVTEGRLLSQAGNAMTVSIIAAIGEQFIEYIKRGYIYV